MNVYLFCVIIQLENDKTVLTLVEQLRCRPRPKTWWRRVPSLKKACQWFSVPSVPIQSLSHPRLYSRNCNESPVALFFFYFAIFERDVLWISENTTKTAAHATTPSASACYLLPSREYPYASYAHKPLSSSDHSRTQWQPTSQLSHSRLGTLQQNQQTNQYSESTTPSQDQRMSLFPQTEGESTGTTVVLPSMTHPIWVMPGELVSLEYSSNG